MESTETCENSEVGHSQSNADACDTTEVSTSDGVMAGCNSSETPAASSSSSQKPEASEYAYLKRGWSSELHKLSIKNIPTCVRYGQVKKLLKKLRVSSHKLTVSVPCAFITFANEEVLADAEKRLTGYVWKGHLLQISRAKPKPDPIMKKREDDERRAKLALNDSKVQKCDLAPPKSEECNVEELRKSIIPYFAMDYDAQIRLKTGKVRAFLRDFAKQRRRASLAGGKSDGSSTWENDYMPFEFVRSPSVFSYRNKCELSVGWCAVTRRDFTIGFRVGKLSKNETRVLRLSDCAFHVPQCVVHFVETILQPAFYNLNESVPVGVDTPSADKPEPTADCQTTSQNETVVKFQSFNPLDRSGHLKTVVYRYSELQNRAIIFVELNLEDDNEQQVCKRLERLKSCIQAEMEKQAISNDITATAEVNEITTTKPDVEMTQDIQSKPDIVAGTDGDVNFNAAAESKKPAFSFELYAIRSNAGSQIPYDKNKLVLLVASDNSAQRDTEQPGCVVEAVGAFRYRVAPASFFQVNSGGARLLYDLLASALRNALPDSRRALLLDVCCGTGTIGLYLARFVHRVVGIELCEAAVRDALHNRLLNSHLLTQDEGRASSASPSKCMFVCRKAEDAIGEILRGELESLTSDAQDAAQCLADFATVGRPVVAVLDPPRAGLHWTVIAAIRKCRAINCVLYVSCNAFAAMSNFVDLVRPESRRVRGTPFRLTSITPIDLFPLTEHFELVLVFTRDPDTEETSTTTATPENQQTSCSAQQTFTNVD